MKCLLLVSSLVVFLAAFQGGQQSAAVDSKVYSPAKFEVTKEQRMLGDLTIKVVQVRKRTPDGEAPRVCRASVEAWKGDNLFKRADYADIDPRDSSYGIFVPKDQPSSRYLIAVKEGDGDPRVLLFSVDGDFIDMAGGFFFASADKHYLITQTTAQGGLVSVFDFTRGEILLDSAEVPPIYNWRAGGPAGGYFFTEALTQEDKPRPIERQDYAYGLYFHPGGVRKVKMVGREAVNSPKVKLDFDPRKFANCAALPQ